MRGEAQNGLNGSCHRKEGKGRTCIGQRSNQYEEKRKRGVKKAATMPKVGAHHRCNVKTRSSSNQRKERIRITSGKTS